MTWFKRTPLFNRAAKHLANVISQERDGEAVDPHLIEHVFFDEENDINRKSELIEMFYYARANPWLNGKAIYSTTGLVILSAITPAIINAKEVPVLFTAAYLAIMGVISLALLAKTSDIVHDRERITLDKRKRVIRNLTLELEDYYQRALD